MRPGEGAILAAFDSSGGSGSVPSGSGVATRIEAALGVVVVSAWGHPSPEDFERSTERMLSDAAWRPGMDILVDYRRLARFGFSTEGMKRVSATFRRRADELGDGRCAVLTPSMLIYGMFRMWHAWLPREFGWEVQAFRTLEEACAWLGVDPAIADAPAAHRP